MKQHILKTSPDLTWFYFVYGVQFNFRGEQQHHRKEAEEGTHTQKGGGGEKHNTTRENNGKQHHCQEREKRENNTNISVIYLTILHSILMSLRHCKIQFQKGTMAAQPKVQNSWEMSSRTRQELQVLTMPIDSQSP